MIVVVDIDGVVCEYNFPKIVKEYFGVDLPADAIFAYDLADVLGVSPSKINEMFRKQVWGEPNFIEGAIPTLKKWRDYGREIIILSNRVKYMGEFGLWKWLNKYSIPYTMLAPDCSFQADYHIDDSPAKLMQINAKTKLLFTQPWNRKCLNIENGMKRVNSWQEIREIIK